jgi:hypothetical protein
VYDKDPYGRLLADVYVCNHFVQVINQIRFWVVLKNIKCIVFWNILIYGTGIVIKRGSCMALPLLRQASRTCTG